MRRIITEWGMVLSSVLVIAFAVLWIDSVLTKWSQEPLAAGSGLYLKSESGRICFFSELGDDWKPSPAATGRWATMSTHHYTNWRLPGIEYHHREFTVGHIVWSLEVTLLLPIGFFLIVIAVCWWLGRRIARQDVTAALRVGSGRESR